MSKNYTNRNRISGNQTEMQDVREIYGQISRVCSPFMLSSKIGIDMIVLLSEINANTVTGRCEEVSPWDNTYALVSFSKFFSACCTANRSTSGTVTLQQATLRTFSGGRGGPSNLKSTLTSRPKLVYNDNWSINAN